jgi:hypothetical protein
MRNDGKISLNGIMEIHHVEVASSLWSRMRGLLGRPAPLPGSCLLIETCGSVHTIGMRYALDLVFVDKNWRVTRVVGNVTPGHFWVWGGWGAVRALETSVGWLELEKIGVGMQLQWSDLRAS